MWAALQEDDFLDRIRVIPSMLFADSGGMLRLGVSDGGGSGGTNPTGAGTKSIWELIFPDLI